MWVGVQQVGGWAAVRRVEDGDPAARAAFRDGYQGHARRSLRIFDELPALYTLPQPHRGPVERRIRDRTGEVRRVLCHGSDGGPGGLARAVREGRPMLEGPTEEQAGQVLRLLPGGRDL